MSLVYEGDISHGTSLASSKAYDVRPLHEVVALDASCSSRWVRWSTMDLGWYWHTHDECELNVVTHGEGVVHIGDYQGRFQAGHAVLMGPGLPHGWKSRGARRRQELIALQFRPADLRKCFAGTPEFSEMDRILTAAGRGLLLDGSAGQRICTLIQSLEETRGLERLTGMLSAITAFKAVIDQPLASPRWQGESQERHPVVATLSSWLADNAQRPIGLAEAAEFAGMNPSACARLFRRYTGHSIVGWLNHLRVGRACDLLRDTDRKIAEIAFGAGFGNLANFNRIFRTFIKLTPREYRRSFRDRPLKSQDDEDPKH